MSKKPHVSLRDYYIKVWAKAHKLEDRSWLKFVGSKVIPTIFGILILAIFYGFIPIIEEQQSGLLIAGFGLLGWGIVSFGWCFVRAPAVIDYEQTELISALTQDRILKIVDAGLFPFKQGSPKQICRICIQNTSKHKTAENVLVRFTSRSAEEFQGLRLRKSTDEAWEPTPTNLNPGEQCDFDLCRGLSPSGDGFNVIMLCAGPKKRDRKVDLKLPLELNIGLSADNVQPENYVLRLWEDGGEFKWEYSHQHSPLEQ